MRKNTSKSNLFGTIKNTAGQNLLEAVTNIAQPIGILPYNYHKIYKIFEEALDSEEADMLRKGFGFDCPRQTQKQIADELGVDPSEVSKRAHAAIEKLQASPYKGRLKALAPTLEEINTLIVNGNRATDAELKSKEYFHRLRNAQRELEKAEEAARTLEASMTKLRHDLCQAQTTIEQMTAERDVAKRRILELEARVKAETSHNTAARKKFREIVNRLESDIFDEDTEITPADTVVGVDDLHLSEGASKALKRVGIKDLSKLCAMGERTLIKLQVGKDNVKEIKEALRKRSLSLK